MAAGSISHGPLTSAINRPAFHDRIATAQLLRLCQRISFQDKYLAHRGYAGKRFGDYERMLGGQSADVGNVLLLKLLAELLAGLLAQLAPWAAA
jgi:hypothetical protein